MSILNTNGGAEVDALKSLLMKIPEGQQSNWDNHLIPHYIARLKEWQGKDLTGTDELNYQYANLLIKNKMMHEFALLKHLPFPQDFADALEWVLMAGEAVPGNKELMTDFNFIYKNFENIMKKNPCSKNKTKK